MQITIHLGKLEDMEREILVYVYQLHNFDKEKTAKALGLSRATFFRKVKKYKLDSRKPLEIFAEGGNLGF